MLRIKWTSLTGKRAKVPADDRIAIRDCGRARERTKGPGGNSLEAGFPPFNHRFP